MYVVENTVVIMAFKFTKDEEMTRREEVERKEAEERRKEEELERRKQIFEDSVKRTFGERGAAFYRQKQKEEEHLTLMEQCNVRMRAVAIQNAQAKTENRKRLLEEHTRMMESPEKEQKASHLHLP